MKRKNILKFHLAGTVIATLTISIFLVATVVSELTGDIQLIQTVKTIILYCIPLLVISMPMLVISGFKLTGPNKTNIHKTKINRMKIIAINGIILIGLAVFLFIETTNHHLTHKFWIAQSLELILGPVNLILIGKNIRSGLRLSGRFKKRSLQNKMS